MSSLSFIRQSGAILLMTVLSACSDTHTPAAPSPTPHPNVAIVSIAVVGESVADGYQYRTIVHLREGAGVAATIVSVAFTFVHGTTPVVSSRHEQPISDGTNVCPASGAIATRELITIDRDPSHPYAATVQATVTFTDGTAFVGSVTGSTDVPPLAAPPPPETFALTGRITDVTTHAGIPGARLEVLSGLNGGKTATADATGTYVFPALVADSFRMRAAADGYDPGEQGVAVPANPRADFELRRSGTAECAYSVTPTGVVNVSFVRGQFGVTITRTGGTCGWRAASDAAWISPSSPTGAGTATLIVAYDSNVSFVGRSGTVTIEWTGGSAQVIVRQPGESPAFCRIVTVTVDGQNPINVPGGGGQFTASISPEPGTPPGVCGLWTATASTGITFVGSGTGPAAPAALTFVVQPNPLAAPRSLLLTISFGGIGPSPSLTINQAGKP